MRIGVLNAFHLAVLDVVSVFSILSSGGATTHGPASIDFMSRIQELQVGAAACPSLGAYMNVSSSMNQKYAEAIPFPHCLLQKSIRPGVRITKEGKLAKLGSRSLASKSHVAPPAIFGQGIADKQFSSGSRAGNTQANRVLQVPPKRAEFFFRPVSVTLYCVMWLAMQTLLVHTILAISRNLDELSGARDSEPSALTEVLTTAARSSPYAPVMCTLFVAQRMYVLASTEGKGEPSHLAKASMIIATCGLTCQILLVVVLPVITNKLPYLRFSDLVGDDCDVHPKIGHLKFSSGPFGTFATVLQWLSMAAIYGGIGGVVFSVYSFGQERAHQPSPAISAAILLIVLFFSVSFILWAVRARQQTWGLLHDQKGKQQRQMMGAALSAAMAVRAAPMLAVLFLAARMRALAVSPPDGEPSPLVGACFSTAVVAIYLQTLVNAYIGYTGSEEVGYYRAHIYKASLWAHCLQHCLGGISLAAAVVVASNIFVGQGLLSPTMNAIMALSYLHLTVSGLFWLTSFLRDCVKWRSLTMQNTILAAAVSVGYCPMLCILFLACRMRALQITEQQGTPQWWEHDCLHLCVMSTIVQVFCCLALPIFTGAAATVDGDGNPTYDLRPMVGAYAVTVVKYVALFCLYGGVIGVCASVITMTPETAKESAHPDDFEGYHETIRALRWWLLAVLVALILSSAKVVGLAVKLGIESVDRIFIGVDITVDQAALSICEGYVNVWGLVIDNPDDRTWQSDCLAKIDRIVVKIDMWELVRSFGKNFVVTALEIEGVEVNYEKGPGDGMANVTWISEFMTGKQSEKAGGSEVVPSKPSQSGKPEPANTTPRTKVTVHRLVIEDIAAEVILPSVGTVARVDLGNLEFEDFNEHCGGQTQLVAGDVVQLVLTTLVKTLLCNTDIMRHLAGKAITKAADSVLGFVTGGRYGGSAS